MAKQRTHRPVAPTDERLQATLDRVTEAATQALAELFARDPVTWARAGELLGLEEPDAPPAPSPPARPDRHRHRPAKGRSLR